jgi:hypothetical protein
MTRTHTARGRSHPRIETTFALFLALVAARVLGSVAAPNSGCFQNSWDTSPIAGCSCHSSCEKCGYYSWPIAYNDCVTCADGSAVVPVYSDGTGTCGGTGGTGSWDVQVPSTMNLFSVPCLLYAGPNPSVYRPSCPALMKKNEDHWCNMADVMELFMGLTSEQAAVEAAVGSSAEFCLASSESDCCEPDAGLLPPEASIYDAVAVYGAAAVCRSAAICRSAATATASRCSSAGSPDCSASATKVILS